MRETDGPAWVNYDEAMARVRSYDDPALRQFVMHAVTIVLTDAQKGSEPRSPLDMLYFVDVQTRLFAQKESLLRILAGEDLGWWGDGQ